MSHRWSSLILSLAIAVILFTSCGKKYSSDKPLPVSYYPSVIISSDDYVVYAINPATGLKNWQFSMPYNALGTAGAPFKPSAIVYHERVYLTAANSDTVYKLNSNTGALIAKLVPTGNPVFTVIGTPIADANLLYIATTNGILYAIDTGTGTTKWSFTNADGSPFYASPVIYNNNIYSLFAFFSICPYIFFCSGFAARLMQKFIAQILPYNLKMITRFIGWLVSWFVPIIGKPGSRLELEKRCNIRLV